MRTDLRLILRWISTTLVITVCLASPAVSAQETFPDEIELPQSPLVVNLNDATVRVLADADAAPILRWRRLHRDAPGAAELSVFQDGAAVVIERTPLPEGERAAALLVEIVASPESSVAVFGANLDLTVERTAVVETPALDIEPPGNLAPDGPIELQLADSRIELQGAAQLSATLHDCETTVRNGEGDHEIAVFGGRLQEVNHRGKLILRSENADVTTEGGRGRLELSAAGGSVELRAANYRFTIEVTDSGLQIIDAKGRGSIVAVDTSADLRDTRFEHFSLTSSMSHMTASQVRGKATITLDGGSLTMDEGEGELTATTQNGATFEVADHLGNLRVNVHDDSRAIIQEVNGEVTLTVRLGEASVVQAKSLALNARGSWVTASGIRRLSSMEAFQSEVDLDLTELADNAVTLAVQTESRVRVSVETPCRVHAQGLASSQASQVDVRGCELQLGRAGRWATRRVRGIDGRPPITVTAKVADTAELIVEGR
ncbi:MAG: hypothetical protein V2I67_21160 [Thermoanaerobaculales bacterium]|jgi:hypothetical protein|nr:hypothetical protein [Thermoanaerobaculales bacterium]